MVDTIQLKQTFSRHVANERSVCKYEDEANSAQVASIVSGTMLLIFLVKKTM